MHLLVAGIPASGKTTFARWLVRHYGYVRCPSGEEPGPAFSTEIAEARSAHADVVIDWGFAISDLPKVSALIADGVQGWWFDGDHGAALAAFLARRGHPGAKTAWDTQIASIDKHWDEIEPLFRGRVLKVIYSGPTTTHVANEARFDLIMGTSSQT